MFSASILLLKSYVSATHAVSVTGWPVTVGVVEVVVESRDTQSSC